MNGADCRWMQAPYQRSSTTLLYPGTPAKFLPDLCNSFELPREFGLTFFRTEINAWQCPKIWENQQVNFATLLKVECNSQRTPFEMIPWSLKSAPTMLEKKSSDQILVTPINCACRNCLFSVHRCSCTASCSRSHSQLYATNLRFPADLYYKTTVGNPKTWVASLPSSKSKLSQGGKLGAWLGVSLRSLRASACWRL